MGSWFSWLGVFVQRRIIAAGILAVNAILAGHGALGSGGDTGELVKAGANAIPAVLLLVDYLRKTDGRAVGLRLTAGGMTAFYALLGFIPGIPDADRATIAQALAGLVAALFAFWSGATANPIPAGPLTSRNS